jgi:1-deoxy-D-xylulose-5-phosphate reductoisomerase
MVAASAVPLAHNRPSRVSILGATGSIGMSTLAVIADRPGDFEIVAVTANDNAIQLAEIARKMNAAVAVVGNPSAYGALKAALSGSGIEAAAGSAAIEAAAGRPADIVVAAIVGAAGLIPTLAALRAGSRVALANKECLVCAGALFMATSRKTGQTVLPVDSEHNAIFQALDGQPASQVEKITITASGGPFRDWSKEAMAAATPELALQHPVWSMGPKVTIDSATLMNKGLELIEAHHLFAMPSEQLEVLVHPESVVHGIVSFRDGSMLAQMSAPDMRTPIAHCLAWPDRRPAGGRRVDLATLGRLTFGHPDLDRFPALKIARQALEVGGWATNILNAANEIAVAAFLSGKIGFLEIAGTVEDTLAMAEKLGAGVDPASAEEALLLDGEGRRIALELIGDRRIASLCGSVDR